MLPTPTAPSQAAWDAMTPEARAAALAALGPMPDHEASPPEGDWHIEAVRVSEDALDGQFQKRGRGVYIGRGITVYYPEERRFAPDLFVVPDVPTLNDALERAEQAEADRDRETARAQAAEEELARLRAELARLRGD
jgi:hypothetical protein